MYQNILKSINNFNSENISEERKQILSNLINYINNKKAGNQTIRLNFICTHNSRRSHLSQIWAQTMAHYFKIKNVFCYSGGTEATAMYSKVVETLINQGFVIQKLSETENQVYAVKFDEIEHPIICFSKPYNHSFNPTSTFGAVMTCDNADVNCPIVFGAEARIPIKYKDPKAFDNTDLQNQKYAERSLEIGEEMWWVFKSIS